MKAVPSIPMLALLLSACGSGPTPQEIVDAAPKKVVRDNNALCEAMTSATADGDLSMRAVFETTAEGRDYGGGIIKQLVEDGKYTFLGGAMVADTCYAHAEARGQKWGKDFDLAWRCPVKILVDDPANPAKTQLALVEDRECDLATTRGAPKKRDVDVEMIHQ